MATAATIIARAIRLLGETESGEGPTPQEYADGLIALNAMMSGWNNERLMCYAVLSEPITLVSGTRNYTFGPSGGTVSTSRTIEYAYVLDGTVSYPVEIITDGEYNQILDKASQARIPTKMRIAGSVPNLFIQLYPVPNSATPTLVVFVRTLIAGFTATTDTVTLPPGWEEAVAYNLALRLAPEYETSARPDVIEIARASKVAIKRTNAKPVLADTDLARLVAGDSFDILNG